MTEQKTPPFTNLPRARTEIQEDGDGTFSVHVITSNFVNRDEAEFFKDRSLTEQLNFVMACQVLFGYMLGDKA